MGAVQDVTEQVAQIQNQLELLLVTVRTLYEVMPVDDEVATTRATVEKIKAKEYASVAEAAFLMNCSDSHVRNLLEKAIVGKATYPIPFADSTVCAFSQFKTYFNGLASRNQGPRRILRIANRIFR